MERRKITMAGQVSVPSRLRRRWNAQVVAFEDKGDHAVIWPLPEDAIGAARGALKGKIASTKDLRVAARNDEARAEARRR
jgi:bifunctional DNA-binding transcriptional regulator/antitoxin component of YhaV-PrlF toxin-antitoxin module